MRIGVKRVLSVLLLLALVFGIVGIKPATKAEAAAKVKRSEFIIMTVKAMEGQKNSAGKTIAYTLNKDGSVEYCGKKITADTVNTLKKKYDIKLESAQYIAIAADMGLIKTKAAAYKSKKAIAKKVTLKVAMVVLVKADAYLNGTSFTSKEVKLAKSRISNIKKAGSSAYQEAMAKAYALGLYVGTKDGDYKTTRTLKYGSKLTAKTAEGYIAKLVNKSKRTQITDDFQVIRTTKLPRTADLYPYILDAYPNAYYDTAWTFYGAYTAGTEPTLENSVYYKEMNTPLEERYQKKGSFYMPVDYIKYCKAGDNECVTPSKNRRLEEMYPVLDQAIEFYTYAMNVDYRTIKKDKEWYKVMSKYLSTKYLDEYIETCIKNKTIVECDVVAGDKSTLYYTDTARFKVYLHFRVISDKVIESKGDWTNDELVPVLTDLSNYTRAYLMYYLDCKPGEWVDYYVSPGIGYGYKLSYCDLNYEMMFNEFGLYPWLTNAK